MRGFLIDMKSSFLYNENVVIEITFLDRYAFYGRKGGVQIRPLLMGDYKLNHLHNR